MPITLGPMKRPWINPETNHPCGCARWDDSPLCPECYPINRVTSMRPDGTTFHHLPRTTTHQEDTMTKYTDHELREAAYGEALVLVASGETRDETFTVLLDSFPCLEAEDISTEMDQAAMDALKQGIEREDVDPSWFA